MTDTHEVPAIILQQLGGRRFGLMTGAKQFTGSSSALSFRLPGREKGSPNYVKIQLNGEDTYDLTFLRMRGVNYRVIAERKSIYADQLQDVFTKVTGLATRF